MPTPSDWNAATQLIDRLREAAQEADGVSPSDVSDRLDDLRARDDFRPVYAPFLIYGELTRWAKEVGLAEKLEDRFFNQTISEDEEEEFVNQMQEVITAFGSGDYQQTIEQMGESASDLVSITDKSLSMGVNKPTDPGYFRATRWFQTLGPEVRSQIAAALDAETVVPLLGALEGAGDVGRAIGTAAYASILLEASADPFAFCSDNSA